MGAAKDAIDIVKSPWWSTKTALVVCTIAVFCAAFTFSNEVSSQALHRWAISLTAAFVVPAAWAWAWRLPRVSRKKVGIVVAIAAEDENQARQLRADFIDSLRAMLRKGSHPQLFQLVECPQHIAVRLQRDGDAEEYAKKTGASVFLYGRARLRRIHNIPSHVVDLAGLVQARPVPQRVVAHLEKSLEGLLPERVVIDPADELIGFEVTTEWIEIVALYAVGLLSVVSRDLGRAEELFLAAQSRMKAHRGPKNSVEARTIAGRITSFLPLLYARQLYTLSEAYYMKRDEQFLIDADVVARKLLALQPKDYSALLTRAMGRFVLEEDIDGAHAELEKCRKVADPSWRYGKAFLHAYSGDMVAARRNYEEAFRFRNADPTVALQCEEFIQIQLERRPERVQLQFCLGLINLRAKKDRHAALRDFTRFLDGAKPGRFDPEIAFARTKVAELSIDREQQKKAG